MFPTQLRAHAAFLLRFPRELRDMIYPDIIKEASPIQLASITEMGKPHPGLHPIAYSHNSHPIIAAEALEAYWQCNTFILNLDSALIDPVTLIHHAIPKPHVRHLLILVQEETHQGLPSRRSEFSEFETKYRDDLRRRRWNELFTFPRLETLTIHMEKQHSFKLCWIFFGPILYELRARNPGFRINFYVSFDKMLRELFDDESNDYQPAGFIDVSDILVAATDEDKHYVDEYLPDKRMPTGRDAIRGLSDELPAQKRVLGSFYFVAEPPLLRVLMEEHWEVYKECEKQISENVQGTT